MLVSLAECESVCERLELEEITINAFARGVEEVKFVVLPTAVKIPRGFFSCYEKEIDV